MCRRSSARWVTTATTRRREKNLVREKGEGPNADAIVKYAAQLLAENDILPLVPDGFEEQSEEVQTALRDGDTNFFVVGEFGQLSACLLILEVVLKVAAGGLAHKDDCLRLVLQGEGGSGKSYIILNLVFFGNP